MGVVKRRHDETEDGLVMMRCLVDVDAEYLGELRCSNDQGGCVGETVDDRV